MEPTVGRVNPSNNETAEPAEPAFADVILISYNLMSFCCIPYGISSFKNTKHCFAFSFANFLLCLKYRNRTIP